MEHRFTNEIGNHIRASVTRDKPIGMVPTVNITLEGPKSVSENVVTWKEAVVLYKLLGDMLRSRARLMKP